MFRQDPSKLLMKDPATATARIYIGNLIENILSTDVETHFAKYGKILGVLLHRGFGFIQFEMEQSANDAIATEHQKMFHGRSLVVRRAQSNATPSGATPDTTVRPGRLLEATPYPVHGGADVARGRGRGTDGSRGARRGIGGTLGRGGRINTDRDRSPIENRDNDEWHDNSGYYSCNNQYNDNSFNKSTYNSSGAFNSEPSNVGPNAPVEPAPDRNDCEIIVVSKALTEYAEFIEDRLKRVGITVDLLFPNEDVPIGRVIANISSRGCLYAILVMPQNQEHQSLTLNILHGMQQEHRNMPLEDAIVLIRKDFEAYYRGDKSSVPVLSGPSLQNLSNVPLSKDRHPDSIQNLLNIITDNRQLTVLQYDKLMRYLQDRREEQVKIELGDSSDVPIDTTQTKTQHELQQRILNILNKPTEPSKKSTIPDVTVVPQWSSPPPAVVTKPTVTATPLLHDPTVQRALDSLMQGNLLKNLTGTRFS